MYFSQNFQLPWCHRGVAELQQKIFFISGIISSIPNYCLLFALGTEETEHL